MNANNMRIGIERDADCVAMTPVLIDPIDFYLSVMDRKAKETGAKKMTLRERILTIRVMEKMKQDPGYAKRLGISVSARPKEKRRNAI